MVRGYRRAGVARREGRTVSPEILELSFALGYIVASLDAQGVDREEIHRLEDAAIDAAQKSTPPSEKNN